MTKKKPANEIRLKNLKATVWANEGSDGRTRYNTTLVRVYKVEPDPKVPNDSGWRESASLGSEELLLAQRLLAEAHNWMLPAQHLAENEEDQGGE